MEPGSKHDPPRAPCAAAIVARLVDGS